MLDDYAIDDRSGALYWTREGSGVSALTAVEVPFLPEPVEGTRGEEERQRFQDAMAHMARALHGLSAEGGESGIARTFELRMAAPRHGGGVRPLTVFFLARSFTALDDQPDIRQARVAVIDDAVRMSRMLISLAPQRLPCEPVRWSSSEGSTSGSLHRSGLTWNLPFAGHLRKHEILTWAKELDVVGVDARLDRSRTRRAERERSRGLVVPALLPLGRADALAVASVMTQTPGAVLLRVALQSTSLTKDEYKALTEMDWDLLALEEAGSPSGALLKKARAAVETTLAADGFFRFSAQVLGDETESVQSVIAVWKMEHDRGQRAAGFETPTATPVARTAVGDADDDYGRAIAQFEAGSGPTPLDRKNASSGLQQTDERLIRLASMVSLVEAPALWRLPTLMPGGQAGLRSRPSNPFEQLPLSTDERFAGDRQIRVGAIRHRGVSLSSHFVLNGAQGEGETGPSVLDRVLLVAGSPGSGKTNFAINFLDEMWTRTRTPFLILDPTLGREFRHIASEDLIVFTVGDQRGNPFTFNPFAVPAGVSIQTHITRLMSCFRAAFWMWDPLPAIFEEAIRLAYARRLGVRETWNAAATLGRDVPKGFPTLDDVVLAMDVVLERQMRLWAAGGEATANQATIVASTSLRLASLVRNYGHVIGSRERGSYPIDVSKMLRHPVVLEMGAIGDGQALALISSFLLVSLVGCIETQGSGGTLDGNEDEARPGFHMLVIEEAHRLLSSGGPATTPDTGNVRAQAADDLNNMLAEVRKYGQGVMILDQRPGSLVGGVIDNAAVVALHKLNEQKGFDHLADMLNLSSEQRRFARVGLEAGESVMFDPLLRSPVLVRPDLRMTTSDKGSREGEDSTAKVEVWRARSAMLADARWPGGGAAPTDRARRAAIQALSDLDSTTPEAALLARVRQSIVEQAPGLSQRGLARACRSILRAMNNGEETVDAELVAAMVHALLTEGRTSHQVGAS